MLRFEAFGPARARAPFVPPPGMRLQEYVLAYDEGRRSTVYIAAHDHGAAFGDAYLFDGKAWVQVAKGATTFGTTQKLGGFYDEARAGIATWNFEHDYEKHRYVATSLLFDVRNGLSPIPASGDDPLAEPFGESKTGTFDYMGLFAPDPHRAVTVCLTRRGVWELDADAVWRKRADHSSDAFPLAWDDDGAGAAFDPVRRRAVFWLYTRTPPREYAFFAWDGKTLARMPLEGLPLNKLHIGIFEPAALIAAHPEHGLVVLAGEHGMFAFDGARWNALPSPRGDVPPRMKNGRMIYDGNVRGLVVGPGYHEGDPGGREQQRVFYVERAGVWERMGVRAVASKLKELSPAARYVNVRGVWYAIGSGNLQTLRWSDADFVEIAPKTELLEGDRVEAAVDARGTPMAITNRGAVFAFEEEKWTRIHDAWKPFGDRSAISAAWDVAGERLVVFADGETFFFARRAWTKPKKRSAPSKEDADFILRYDGALKRVLRFGADVAMLENDAWTPIAAKRYGKLCGPRAWEHFPAHDAKTGETVLVNLERRTVVRFDVSGCADVDTIEIPDDIDWTTWRDTLTFERSTRLVHAQNPDRSSHRLALDLGPAFDAARSLGPRKVPAHATLEVAAVGARLYHPKKKTFWFLEGDLAHAGPIGEEGTAEKVGDAAAAIAAKRKAGYVPAAKLPLAFLAELGARKSRALRVGKKTTVAKPGTSHVGGLPSIAPKSWPKSMSFVAQLDARGLLRKHAGVAIFGDETSVVAILVTPLQWKKKPAAAPKGVAVLAPRPITIAPARFEIDADRVRALAGQDSAMTTAFERFAKRAQIQTSPSKLGGAPTFTNAAEIPATHTLLAQLDLDTHRVLVFIDAAERSPLALTQPLPPL